MPWMICDSCGELVRILLNRLYARCRCGKLVMLDIDEDADKCLSRLADDGCPNHED